MINSIGLPNRGLEGFLDEDLPRLARAAGAVDRLGDGDRAVRTSVAWSAASGSGRGRGGRAERLLPNVHSGLIVGEQPGETEGLLEALRPLTEKPLIVKLTPNVADPAAVAVGRGAGWRGRRLADQHAEGQRDRPGER